VLTVDGVKWYSFTPEGFRRVVQIYRLCISLGNDAETWVDLKFQLTLRAEVAEEKLADTEKTLDIISKDRDAAYSGWKKDKMKSKLALGLGIGGGALAGLGIGILVGFLAAQ